MMLGSVQLKAVLHPGGYALCAEQLSLLIGSTHTSAYKAAQLLASGVGGAVCIQRPLVRAYVEGLGGWLVMDEEEIMV